jgi:ubiquinone/menaquinone biosynthesis C-methylase UbiE
MAVRWSGARPGGSALDVCCGSGDLAFELATAVGPSGRVTGLDFAAEMLEDAEARRDAAAAARPAARPLAPMAWVQGDALALPFADGSFDAATMGYGLRNVADIPRALSELARVLRPGASAAVLDFNNSTDPLVDGVQARGGCGEGFGGLGGQSCRPEAGRQSQLLHWPGRSCRAARLPPRAAGVRLGRNAATHADPPPLRTHPTPRRPQAFFLERLVVPAAAAYGLSAEYEYLRPSIKRFPTGPEQERMALAAGFASARHYDVGFGLMGCLVATKAAE